MRHPMMSMQDGQTCMEARSMQPLEKAECSPFSEPGLELQGDSLQGLDMEDLT